jgi:hypothetical protein
MNIIDSDVFILDESVNTAEVILHYQKHIKFCLKQEFYIGLPFSCKEELITQFNQLFSEHGIAGQVFFYFTFKPHQSIQSIVDEHHQSNRWSNQIHLMPLSDLQYGSYKEELWDLHLATYSVYFHELNHAKEFSKNLELISKLNARGGIVGVSSSGLTSKKLKQLVQSNSINFFNTQSVNIHSKDYADQQKLRRELEELILNSSSLDQPGEVLN